MKKKAKIDQNHFWGYLMVAPTIIGLLALNVYPFLQTIYLSFTNAKVFGKYKFVGLSNYMKMITSEEFLRATWNTILFCILTVPLGVLLALVVAVLLNAKIKGKTAFRAIFFLPMVVAPAAVAMVWNGCSTRSTALSIRFFTLMLTGSLTRTWSSLQWRS